MSDPLYDSRLGSFSWNGQPIPFGSDDGMTITRQPEVRFGAAVGNQPPPLEFVGHPQVEISFPAGALTLCNRLLAAAAAECFANASISAGAAATFGDVVAITADGFRFSGRGYIMAPTTLEGRNASPTRTSMVFIPNGSVSLAGVASALAGAGVIA